MQFRAGLQLKQVRTYSLYWGAVFACSGLTWLIAAAYGGSLGSRIGRHRRYAVVLLSPPSVNNHALLAERFPTDFEHLGERYALLTIIVLGESFVKVLSSLAGAKSGLGLYPRRGRRPAGDLLHMVDLF